MVGEKKSDLSSDKSTRIALVDGQSMFREALVELLGREPGLEVCGETGDRHRALGMIKTKSPDLAIVGLDLVDSQGIDLIRDLKTHCPKVAVLVLSMHQEPIFAERALRAGARGFIDKQQAFRHLVAAIHKIIAGEIVTSETLVQIALKLLAGGQHSTVDQSVSRLSDREAEVLTLIGKGFNTHQIAAKLHVDVTTVETYRSRLKEKLKLKGASELLQYAIRCVHDSQ
jgi:DNA-binding NarL/FixJ family response regulator